MNAIGVFQSHHLVLDKLTINPNLVRRLAPTIAQHYHALPVAEDRGCITIAMANPNDAAAREAITQALDAPSFIVAGDRATIDALLAQVWSEANPHNPHLLVCVPGSPLADKTLAFSQELQNLLDAQASRFCLPQGDHVALEALLQQVEQRNYDLVIWHEPKQTWFEHLRFGPLYRQVIKHQVPLLLVRRPHWPLRRLLLILQGEPTDDIAINWVVRLARSSNAAVTVLAIVPPAPAMYGPGSRMQPSLEALLTSKTALGQQMQRTAQWLVDWGIKATLRLRQGAPDQEILREMDVQDYSLVAVRATAHGARPRWLSALLRQVNQSALVVN